MRRPRPAVGGAPLIAPASALAARCATWPTGVRRGGRPRIRQSCVRARIPALTPAGAIAGDGYEPDD